MPPNISLRGIAYDNVFKATVVDLTLPVTPDPLTTLQGVVTDANGAPVEGATVVATSRGLTAELFRVSTEMTELPQSMSATPDAKTGDFDAEPSFPVARSVRP